MFLRLVQVKVTGVHVREIQALAPREIHDSVICRDHRGRSGQEGDTHGRQKPRAAHYWCVCRPDFSKICVNKYLCDVRRACDDRRTAGAQSGVTPLLLQTFGIQSFLPPQHHQQRCHSSSDVILIWLYPPPPTGRSWQPCEGRITPPKPDSLLPLQNTAHQLSPPPQQHWRTQK